MRTIAYVIAFTLWAFRSGSGADVEARVVRFIGEIPSTLDLVRLTDSNSIPAQALSAKLDEKDSFEYRAITPTEYPTSFDANGNPDSTEQRETGIIFSGSATAAGDACALAFRFSLDEQTYTALDRTSTGAIIAQPLFRKKMVETKLTFPAGEWQLVRTPDDKITPAASCPIHTVLLVRVRK